MRQYFKRKKILIVALMFAAHSVTATQPLMNQFMESEEKATKALRIVLEDTQVVDSTSLLFASSVAIQKDENTNAAYLFYIAKFRAQFDKAMFPPTGTGGNTPMILFGALTNQLGSLINPVIMRLPDQFAKSIALTSEWKPLVPEGYDPGWEHHGMTSVDTAMEQFQSAHESFNVGMGNIAKLLQMPPYFDAFLIVQDYNLSWDEGKPSKDEFDNAEKTMMEIEQSEKIEGMYWKPD